MFSKHGEVVHVEIKIDKTTKNNLGFGFVGFKVCESQWLRRMD